MSAIDDIDIDRVLDELVDQFADPMAFLRELVQNAIDAGSGEIAVDFSFESDASPGSTGRMVIEVRDFGEGMDRQVIEERLLRLFSSGKDEDFTKIGRFGIGFVSVFAIEPEAVCLDTGRSGEYWRLVFDEGRSFDLLELDRPVEGTQIRIFKKIDQGEFESFRRRGRRVLTHWCKHARVPIYVDGEDIRQPFEVDSPCQVTHREEGTRLVAGLVADRRADYGYYNRGLTLEEGEGGPWPHVAFKIDSRYLEHTLTRDQVVEDRHFHKAEELIEEAITGEMIERLVDRIEQTAGDPDRALEHDRLCGRLADYLRDYGRPPGDWRARPLIPVAGGEAISLEACREAVGQRHLMLVEQDSVVEALDDDYIPVPVEPHADGVRSLISRLLDDRFGEVWTHFVVPHRGDGPDEAEAMALFDRVTELLELLGDDPPQLGWCSVHRESPLRTEIALPVDRLGEPISIADVPTPDRRALGERAHLLVNRDHETVGRLVEAADGQPDWAAYQLVKLLCRTQLDADEDARLVAATIDRRDDRGVRRE
jgi:hypothetical protein